MITVRGSLTATRRSACGPARYDQRAGLALIALAVLEQVGEDLRSEGEVTRADAQAFLDDEDFATWCEIAGLAPGRVRRALLGLKE